MKKYLISIGTKFPYQKEKEIIPGNVKKAMNQFAKWKYDYTRLFHGYCDLIGISGKGFTLWQDIAHSKGVPVIGGVSVDETLLEKYVWELRKIPADQMISLIYYSGKNNRSAFEVGFLATIIESQMPEDTYVFNPSSYLVRKTLGECKGYVVWDEYLTKAYSNQFCGERFLSYDQYDEIEQNARLVALVNDIKEVEVVCNVMKEQTPKEMIVSIPQSLFKKCREEFISKTTESNMYLQGVIMVDKEIMPASPKKHLVLFYGREPSDFQISVRVLSLLDGEMLLGGEEYYITEEYFLRGPMTINDVIRLNTAQVEKKQRNRPEEYYFSREIRIQYKQRKHGDKKTAIVSYSSIPDARGRTKKISRNIEKGLQYTTEEDLKQKLIHTVFYDELYTIISNDIAQHYSEKYETISLKTLWYLYRSKLLKKEKYDDSLCMEIFVNQENDIQNICYLDMLTGKKSNVLDKLLAEKKTTEKKNYITQLYLLFDCLIRDKRFLFNPFRELMLEYSNRMSEEQYEVRNALVKKNLSIDQQRMLLERTCRTGEWVETEDIKTLIVCFRLLTGIPVREMLALKWSDLIENTDYGFYQIKVTMMIDKTGGRIVYGTRDDWKRFRLIPLVSIVSRLLFRRKKRCMRKYNLSEEKMADIPIFCEGYDRRRKQQQIMQYETINKVCREGVANLDIPKFEVRLPGDKELLTDLNRYYSDLFLSNFRFHANHTCMMTRGEINYLLGIQQEDTFAQHYCDYTNDAIQYQMLRKLMRWSLLLTNDRGEGISNTALAGCLEIRIHAKEKSTFQIRFNSQFGGTTKLRKMRKDSQNEKD